MTQCAANSFEHNSQAYILNHIMSSTTFAIERKFPRQLGSKVKQRQQLRVGCNLCDICRTWRMRNVSNIIHQAPLS